MQEAQRANDRIREAGRRLVPGPSPEALRPYRDAFFEALRNDFNTPEARAALFNWVREANRSEPPVGDADLREMLTVLGLESLLEAQEGAPPEAVELARRRDAARGERDWAEADRLRDELRALGWEVRDGPEGAELVPV
jgi:cysteinyl-tRNA synthetase